MKVLAIRTDFSHHGEDFGYKQILKLIAPYKVLGINERDPSNKSNIVLRKYPWLFEFQAYKFRNEIDLVHILYGEDYYRWSGNLFKGIPVVATFHQPAETLEKEVLYGDYRGRIGKLTHKLTKRRFEKLAAAIVTNPSQKEVLKKVMPAEKIHHIPLGIYLDELNRKFEEYQLMAAGNATTRKNILTVGVWLRDWDFYFKIVEECSHLNFALVNKRFEKEEIEKLKNYKNITFYEDISDGQLFDLFLKSDLQFLPVTGFAGSNAFLQGLALGCPIVLTDINADQFKGKEDFVQLYEKGNVSAAISKINNLLSRSNEKIESGKNQARTYASQFSWEEVAKKTINLYKTLI